MLPEENRTFVEEEKVNKVDILELTTIEDTKQNIELESELEDREQTMNNEEDELSTTTPSVKGNRKKENKESQQAQISDKELEGSTTNIIHPPSIECQIKRGKCLNHKIEARKVITTSKRWGKMKKGYGWIYSRRVTYSCAA